MLVCMIFHLAVLGCLRYSVRDRLPCDITSSVRACIGLLRMLARELDITDLALMAYTGNIEHVVQSDRER